MATKKIVFLSLVPLIIVSIYIYFFGLNIPFLDQWEVTPLLIKRQQGLLSLSDLFAQHNEHRPFFPRLIWIILSGFTHYNVNFELWLNLLIAVVTFLFVIDRSIKLWQQLQIDPPVLLIPLISFLVFNLGQNESWLQGFQTTMFLGTACVIFGVFILSEHVDSWVVFFVAIILGAVANYSMANGLFYWLIGLIIIPITASQKTRLLKIFLWLFFSSVFISIFFTGWTSGHLNFTYLFTHILEWAVWVANFLGAPIMTLWYIAWVFGCLSVCLYILIIGHVIRMAQWRLLIPYFAIAIFVLFSTLVISLGRMEMGLPQSVVPRYLTISVWYWVSLLVLLPLLNMKSVYKRIFYSLLTLSLVVLMIKGGWRGYLGIYQRMLPAYQAVHSGQMVSDEALSQIYPNPDIARSRLEFLCKNHLSVCADMP